MGLNKQLLNAAQTGDSNRVLKLIQQGADVNGVNGQGETPLHLAVLNGNALVCYTLLRKGAKTSTFTTYGSSPLKLSISKDHDQIVRLLLENGADPNLKCSDSRSVFDVAVQTGAQHSIFAHLIEHGADVNNAYGVNRNLMHWACENRHADLVELLLLNGVSVEVSNSKNEKPMDVAKRHNYTEIVDLIQRHYALWLPLWNAARRGNFAECFSFVKQGALVHHSTVYCPLAAASNKGHYEIVKLLLIKGAKINNRDNNENNPLYLATKKGHEDIAILLMYNGANINMHVSPH